MENNPLSTLLSSPVLVVDDMSLGRLSAKKLLQQFGFSQVEMASSGLNAWDLLLRADEAKKPFTLVFCDWIMPEMNGVELIRKLKTRKWTIMPQVVLVTAETEIGLVKEAMEEGAAGYVRKPLSFDSLRAALDKISIEKIGKPG